MPEAERLRKLAEWFRGFAAVGNSADRQSRTDWATVLDRMADDEERRAHQQREVAIAERPATAQLTQEGGRGGRRRRGPNARARRDGRRCLDRGAFACSRAVDDEMPPRMRPGHPGRRPGIERIERGSKSVGVGHQRARKKVQGDERRASCNSEPRRQTVEKPRLPSVTRSPGGVHQAQNAVRHDTGIRAEAQTWRGLSAAAGPYHG